MKARRKSNGEIIEVREWRGASDVIYSSPDMNHFYQASELDFNFDAEGEEMLTVSRKEVMRNYAEKVAWKNHHQSSKHDRDMAAGWCNALRFLFGLKCLPDGNVSVSTTLSQPTFTDNCQSQCKSQDHFPDPAKKADVNRLRVAGMAMAAIISRGKSYDKQEIAVTALEYADTLIAECGKGGEQCYEEALSDVMLQMLELIKEGE